MFTKRSEPKSTQVVAVDTPLSIGELGSLLVRHYGLHDGLFEILVEYQIGMGPIGPNPEQSVPGAMIGVSRIGLAHARISGPMTIDAAKVNPSPAPKKKAK